MKDEVVDEGKDAGIDAGADVCERAGVEERIVMTGEALESACAVAAGALARFLGLPVTAAYLGRHDVDPRAVVAELGGDEAELIGVLIGIQGDLVGDLLFAFFPAEADALARRLAGDGLGTEMGDSAIRETTNILASRWLSGLADGDHLRLMPTAPLFARDMAAAVVAEVLAGHVERRGTATIIETRFRIGGLDAAPRILIMAERHAVSAREREEPS